MMQAPFARTLVALCVLCVMQLCASTTIHAASTNETHVVVEWEPSLIEALASLNHTNSSSLVGDAEHDANVTLKVVFATNVGVLGDVDGFYPQDLGSNAEVPLPVQNLFAVVVPVLKNTPTMDGQPVENASTWCSHVPLCSAELLSNCAYTNTNYSVHAHGSTGKLGTLRIPDPNLHLVNVHELGLTAATATFRFTFGRSDIRDVVPVVCYFEPGNAYTLDDVYPRLHDETPTFSLVHTADQQTEVTVSLNLLSPFTKYRLRLSVFLDTNVYSKITLSFVTDIAPIVSPPQDFAQSVSVDGTDRLLFTTKESTPVTGQRYALEIDAQDTLEPDLSPPIQSHVFGRGLFKCFSPLSSTPGIGRMAFYAEHLLPNSNYVFQTREVLDTSVTLKSWRYNDTLQQLEYEPPPISQAQSVSEWSSTATGKTDPAVQAPLHLEYHMESWKDTHITWSITRLYSDSLQYFTLQFVQAQVDTLQGTTTYSPTGNRTLSASDRSVTVNTDLWNKKNATHLFLTSTNDQGTSLPSNYVFIDKPIEPKDSGLTTSQKSAVVIVSVLTGIALILVVTWYVKKRSLAWFVFPSADRWELDTDEVLVNNITSFDVCVDNFCDKPNFIAWLNTVQTTHACAQALYPSYHPLTYIIAQAERRYIFCFFPHCCCSPVHTYLTRTYFSCTRMHEKLVEERQIGQGYFGVVHRGSFRGMPVAIKRMRPGIETEQIIEFIEEGLILKALCDDECHPNITQLVGVAMQKFPLVIVTELLPMGSLDQLFVIPAERETMDLHQRLLFSLDIVSAMRFLKKKRIVHRDLSAKNCLVTSAYTVKVSDFGLARTISGAGQQYGGKYKATSVRLVPSRWSAPEVFTTKVFNELSDVWSFGVTMWEIFSDAQLPYSQVEECDVLIEVLSGLRLSQPENCPTILYLLMQRCWETRRPSFHKIEEFLLRVFDKFELDPYTSKPRVPPRERLAQLHGGQALAPPAIQASLSSSSSPYSSSLPSTPQRGSNSSVATPPPRASHASFASGSTGSNPTSRRATTTYRISIGNTTNCEVSEI
eukprot:m.195127 g.195127  ORF g.195127 m.195127 type:complete len:1047 (+) comp14889_c0_seq41:296-3436(+)